MHLCAAIFESNRVSGNATSRWRAWLFRLSFHLQWVDYRLWVPLCACGIGGAFALAMTLPLDYTHSPDEANRWNAFVLTVGYLIAASGPFLMGVMRDYSGDFTSAYHMLVGVSLLMLVIAPLLKPHAIE